MIRLFFFAKSFRVAQTKAMGFRWRGWRDYRRKSWIGRRTSWLIWKNQTARLCTHRNRGATRGAGGERRNRSWTCYRGSTADENQLVIKREPTCPKSVELNLA